jgi:molybdenum cofactor synthesis domain-containing protein
VIKTAILTVSTRCSQDRQKDLSSEIIRNLVKKIDCDVFFYKIVPDEKTPIRLNLLRLADELDAELILTTGGTGLSNDDVTPEATLEIIERRLPGFEEAMRTAGFTQTPYALLSRAVAGTRGQTMIINLPGSPKGVEQNLSILLPVIPHGIKLLKNQGIEDSEHQYHN